ncbi:hypothetical protein OG568_43130 [Streptomyces sp. NBC_01450]|uniref:hypothetical protein n=1 Tax=Streptomyces sp. NBC_01450 TaxID=2903871 RepID=UPI002E36207A|nr:hypothetical protein [Streptomyces sp. NBC_01450]
MSNNDLETLSVNTIRTLCMDAVQAADSGRPGTPMGILTGVQAVDPDYEVLGRPVVTLDDLRTFRRLGSRCPGHPEYRWTSGVETTTGPLSQGVATSVGMAIAGQWLAARTTATTSPSSTSTCTRWPRSPRMWRHAVARALHPFTSENERPTLIVVHSHIGYGSPVEDTPKAHGEPFGVEGVRTTHPELADELGRIQRRCVWGESRGPMGSTASARPGLRSATTRRRTR